MGFKSFITGLLSEDPDMFLNLGLLDIIKPCFMNLK